MTDALRQVLDRLQMAGIDVLPDEENWGQMIQRIKQPGTLHQVEDETYGYFLEVLPPHYQGDSFFTFAEGREPLRLFLTRGPQKFCRQLTWEETCEFCQAAGVPLPG